MHLKELDIFGFKSFPEKTNLKFEPGITVVVGPNGCGKSNVFDGIKWALGEQSPKSLRGSKMEDIIFNGTDHHPALSYAEVTLTFLNEDKYLPIDYKEVSITRKLYRSGESEYYINKNIVRLKDIEELFMGTGIGESTYSFIEQGKIEIFLSYKPEDKRLIFDEASGIVKYKERKKETMRRLEEADENLLRLEDIIAEVKRQTRYLERQVEKARKYRETQDALLAVEKKIATIQSKDVQEKIDKHLEELGVLKSREEEKSLVLEEAKKEYEASGNRVKEVRSALEAVNAAFIALNADITAAQNNIKFYEQMIVELRERNGTIEQASAELTERHVIQEKRLAEERVRFEGIDASVAAVEREIVALCTEKDKLRSQSHEASKKIEIEKLSILQQESKKANINNSLIEIQTNLAGLVNRKKRLLLDRGRLEALRSESESAQRAKEEEVASRTAELESFKQRKNALVLREQELSRNKETLKENLIEKERELFELQSYYEFLKDLHTKYETFSVTKKITVIFDEEPVKINKLVASLSGVQFSREGAVYKAVVEAKVVSLEENQLQDRIAQAKQVMDQMRQSLERLTQQKEEVNQEAVVGDRQIEDAESILRDRLQEKETLRRECARLDEEYTLLENETQTTTGDIASFEANQKDFETELAHVDQVLAAAQESLGSLHRCVDTCTQRATAIDIENAKKEAFKDSLRKEKETLQSKIVFLEEEKGNIAKNIETFVREKEENSKRAQALAGDIENVRVSIGSFERTMAEQTLSKAALEQEEVTLGERLEAVRQKEQALEKECEGLRGELYNKKLEIQSFEYEKGKIIDYLAQVYHVTFEPLLPEEISQPLGVYTDERDMLKKKVEALGEVNLVAIEEFEELKKRDDFLVKQKDDLITSKENLKKAIQKINKTSKELFLDTFNKVQEEFNKNFRFLFGGGKAQLLLLDPENVLESGVEIEVQPPGKKLQNVSLLSGGEKALTAISLIFAIFRIRPSPICVLDEIDAPLDEANVDRFNHMLKEFVHFSQFIVITHNKKTMSNADVLYGVTMQEKGVSKLVSVKFAERERAKHPLISPLRVPSVEDLEKEALQEDTTTGESSDDTSIKPQPQETTASEQKTATGQDTQA